MHCPLKVMSAVETLFKGSHTDTRLRLVQYLLRVVTLLFESFNDELSYIKFQIRGKSTLGYIKAFAQHRHNSVLLMKKILQNNKLFDHVIMPALNLTGLFPLTEDRDEVYKPQYFMATIIDYIWIQKVYNNQKQDVVDAYTWMVDTLRTTGRINELSR